MYTRDFSNAIFQWDKTALSNRAVLNVTIFDGVYLLSLNGKKRYFFTNKRKTNRHTFNVYFN